MRERDKVSWEPLEGWRERQVSERRGSCTQRYSIVTGVGRDRDMEHRGRERNPGYIEIGATFCFSGGY